MSAYAYRLRTAYPLSLMDVANAAAAIIDPDTGGDKTFTADNQVRIGSTDYVVADIPVWEFDEGAYPELRAAGYTDYGSVIKSRSPALWFAVLFALAQARGREFTLTLGQIESLCAAVLFDEEITE